MSDDELKYYEDADKVNTLLIQAEITVEFPAVAS